MKDDTEARTEVLPDYWSTTTDIEELRTEVHRLKAEYIVVTGELFGLFLVATDQAYGPGVETPIITPPDGDLAKFAADRLAVVRDRYAEEVANMSEVIRSQESLVRDSGAARARISADLELARKAQREAEANARNYRGYREELERLAEFMEKEFPGIGSFASEETAADAAMRVMKLGKDISGTGYKILVEHLISPTFAILERHGLIAPLDVPTFVEPPSGDSSSPE